MKKDKNERKKKIGNAQEQLELNDRKQQKSEDDQAKDKQMAGIIDYVCFILKIFH